MHVWADAARTLGIAFSAAHPAGVAAAPASGLPAATPASAGRWVVPVVTTFHWPAAARPVRVVWWLPAFVRAWLPAS